MATKTIEFKSFDWLSVAKMSAVFGALLGFLLNFIGILVIGVLGSAVPVPMDLNGYLLFASLIFWTIILAIVGFICGAVSTFIYNFIASKVGGIKVRV